MRRMLAFAFVIVLLGGWSDGAEARFKTLAGSWMFDVMPQAAPPEFPEPPPPFVSIFNFDFAGTATETDSALNPNTVVGAFPPKLLPPFTSSDGFGSWKRLGHSRFRTTFIKLLFDTEGLPLGFVITTLDLEVAGDGSLQGEGVSDFVLGSDPDGEVIFDGPVLVQGRRLEVRD